MKAKLVHENLNFKRGTNPKSSLNIGIAQKARKLLDEIYNNPNRFVYTYYSEDKIIIRYTPKRIKARIDWIRANNSNDIDPYPLYLAKFDIKPLYEAIIDNENRWQIYKNKFYPRQWADEWKIELKFELVMHGGFDSQEKAGMIVNLFNDKYGDLEYLELLKSYDLNAEEYEAKVKYLIDES